MTLIEIMVVVVIIAMVAGGTIYGLGLISRTSLKSACMRVIAASHFAYARAIARGTTMRIVIDADQNQLGFEEARGRVELVHANDTTRLAVEDEQRRDGDDTPRETETAAVDPWAAAQAAIQRTEHPTFGASPFGCIRDDDGDCIKRYQMHDIADGVHVKKMFLPHEPEPRVRGRGSIYFFPGGRTEHAVIQFTDGRSHIYTVELNPLTGRGTLHAEEWEPVSIPDDTVESDSRRSELSDQ